MKVEPKSVSLSVHKFGGAALADATGIRRAAELVTMRGNAPTVVVTSALFGVTDALISLALQAASGDMGAVSNGIAVLREKHLSVGRDLCGGENGDLTELVERAFDELERICALVVSERRITPAVTDAILARGERLSARFVASAIARMGLKATAVDATEIIRTEGVGSEQGGGVGADLGATTTAARTIVAPLLASGTIVVVPGFIGARPRGEAVPDLLFLEENIIEPVGSQGHSWPVTLGRGGSDLSATILARALDAGEVVLWKDVPGILTADPRAVPDARVVPELHIREAAELAYYGAKVLHPRALVPVTGRIRVYVRPYATPGDPGTEISMRRTGSRPPVRALSAVTGQALVTVSGSGMLGVPGIAARTFGALARANISVSLISQASSEHSICIAIPEPQAAVARAKLLEAFEPEIALGDIDGVEVQSGLATLAVVGLGMAHTPGVAGRLFSALGDGGINIVAIAQGSSELNISFVVESDRAAEAQRVIHSAFHLEKQGGGRPTRERHRDVILLGFGRIGRELASHLAHTDSARARLRIVGVIDRSGYLFDRRGISAQRLSALASAKEKGRGSTADFPGGISAAPEEALAQMASHALVRPILADLAAGDTRAVVLAAVQQGMDLVLANKVPLASDRESADSIIKGARAKSRRVLHEATVGAGLPIIDTVKKLQEAGDRIMNIEGCPSGTLGFLFGELGRGRKFSEAVRDAMTAGYTEPDPRDDLSGLDVARKALILGRLLGFQGEIQDVVIESLVPASLQDVPLADFMARLPEVDEEWSKRVEETRGRGEVLRYRARATSRQVAVRLVAVPVSSPLGSLQGTDNQFVFTTARYLANPLIITGPGAGPAVTAAGVLNDLLALSV